MTTVMPERTTVRRRKAARAAGPLLAIATLALAVTPIAAKPLDADACARLKFERDALEAAGVRSALTDQPPPRPVKTLDERAEKLSKLIQLDGQLRFRCGLDLPISTLRPDALVEVPDTVEGEAVVKPVPRRPAPKKANAAPVTSDQPKAADTAVPVPKRTKSAASKAEKSPDSQAPAVPATTEAPATKSRPKPKVKVDDAFRPVPKSDSGDQ